MTWGGCGTFVSFAAAIVLAPGSDVAVVRRNSLRGGRRDGVLAAWASWPADLRRARRPCWGYVYRPPRSFGRFVSDVDARVVSVDRRAVSVDPRGNWG